MLSLIVKEFGQTATIYIQFHYYTYTVFILRSIMQLASVYLNLLNCH